MGIVTLIIAALITAYQVFTNSYTLNGADQYLENVANVESFFFGASWILWFFGIYGLSRLWKHRQKVFEKIMGVLEFCGSLIQDHGIFGVFLALVIGVSFGILLLMGGLTVFGVLLLPVFEGVSAWLARAAADAWLPTGPRPDFFLFVLLWLLLIGA